MPSIDHDDLVAFVDSVRRLLADRSTEADVRRAIELPGGHDPDLWRELASIGVAGLLVDPCHGGVGAGPVELERVTEEIGATLACSPMLSSGVLAAGLLQATDDADAQARCLPGIADGSCIATVALTGTKGGWTEHDVAVAASPADGGWRLDGTAGFVTHAQVADLLLVVARTPDGIGVFELPAQAQGVAIAALPVFDRTQPMAAVSFTHAPADLLLESESCTSAARHAARRLAERAEDAAEAVSLAAFACADAFVNVAATSIQMHGGIAFTWAHPAHLYLRRARADAQLFGAPAAYRERYVRLLEARA